MVRSYTDRLLRSVSPSRQNDRQTDTRREKRERATEKELRIGRLAPLFLNQSNRCAQMLNSEGRKKDSFPLFLFFLLHLGGCE